jgi:hypothetical protein
MHHVNACTRTRALENLRRPLGGEGHVGPRCLQLSRHVRGKWAQCHNHFDVPVYYPELELVIAVSLLLVDHTQPTSSPANVLVLHSCFAADPSRWRLPRRARSKQRKRINSSCRYRIVPPLSLADYGDMPVVKA